MSINLIQQNADHGTYHFQLTKYSYCLLYALTTKTLIEISLCNRNHTKHLFVCQISSNFFYFPKLSYNSMSFYCLPLYRIIRQWLTRVRNQYKDYSIWFQIYLKSIQRLFYILFQICLKLSYIHPKIHDYNELVTKL